MIARRLLATVPLARAVLRPTERPDRLVRGAIAARPWGRGIAGLGALAAARAPDAPAMVDEHERRTYAEMWERAHAIADLVRSSIDADVHSVGVLAHNRVGFLEMCVGVAMSGADLVLLNTGLAPGQLAEVVAAERIGLVLHDDDLAATVAECDALCVGERTLDQELTGRVAAGCRVDPPAAEGRTVLLTSGTTGRPKGAARSTGPAAAESIAGVLARIPLRPRDVQVVPAPLFHAWGFTHLLLGLARCATTVTSRRFDPARTVELVERHRARVLVAVPVMLQRLLDLDGDRLDRRLGTLEIVAASGSAMPGTVVSDWLTRVGPNLFNLYGSTEVAVASVATPADLARDPRTAGRVVPGTTVEILDPQGHRVAPGETGRIFVGNAGRFDGYTSGGGKETVRGLLASGDLGRFDADGLLFVEGREDDMIVSGGENLFPGPVEDVLTAHPEVVEAAVVGIPDAEFGQVLAAYVVARPGSAITPDELREHVRSRLARFEVPKVVHLVGELPRTTSGKIVHRRLRDDGE